MSIEELSQELQEHEQKRSFLLLQMDSLCHDIQTAMPAAAASWMQGEVERKVRANPKVVQSHGVDRLRELKAKLKNLIENLPNIVAVEFREKGVWPHHTAIHPNSVGEPYLNRVFRYVVSHLGDLLEEFDLIDEYPASWERVRHKYWRYVIDLGLHHLPELKIDEYKVLFDEYKSLEYKIDNIQKSLAEAKAMELWEKA